MANMRARPVSTNTEQTVPGKLRKAAVRGCLPFSQAPFGQRQRTSARKHLFVTPRASPLPSFAEQGVFRSPLSAVGV